jgi:uncharacterized protein YaiI (UPF0178 family)
LVVTGYIPLAYEVICKGGYTINPRGELHTVDNIKDRLKCVTLWIRYGLAESILVALLR